MRGIIIAIVATAACTAGVCFYAFQSSPTAGATIDGSTEESFKASIDSVKKSMAQLRQEEFEQAMATLASAVMLPDQEGHALTSIMAMTADPGAAGRKLRTRVHGLTGNEVIAAAVAAAAAVDKRGAKMGGLGGLLAGSLTASRLTANESAAIATLKNISSAQEQCQAAGVIDGNGNGAGEYGFFAELAGIAPVRGTRQCVAPPVLSSAFGKVHASLLMRSGYAFQMYLPDAKAAGIAEAPTGGGDGVAVDCGQAEVLWCCYAWPTDLGTSGNRAFFVNQSGDVLACSNKKQQYTGTTRVPTFTAAFQAGGKIMSDVVAANSEGNDGETWLVVN